MQIEPGAQGRVRHVVSDHDTAIALGTGEVPVLATSRAVAWCEQASLATMAPFVPTGSTSVAMRVHVDHIRAAAPGCAITATATLERVEGRRYSFVVSATDDRNQEIASGRIVRVVVEVGPFLARSSGSQK